MLQPINSSETPPGGWRYLINPETGYMVYGGSLDSVINACRQYLGNNGKPIPRDLDQQILRWMDDEIQKDANKRGLPPVQFLHEEEPPSLLKKAFTFAYESARWVANGAQRLNQQQLEARLDICKTCSYWRGSPGFGLGSCGKCGCKGLKLYMATTSCPIGKWTALN